MALTGEPEGTPLFAGIPVADGIVRQWSRFCDAIGRPELVDDPRYALASHRVARRAEVNALLEDWMATFASDEEVVAALDKFRVPAAPVLRP